MVTQTCHSMEKERETNAPLDTQLRRREMMQVPGGDKIDKGVPDITS